MSLSPRRSSAHRQPRIANFVRRRPNFARAYVCSTRVRVFRFPCAGSGARARAGVFASGSVHLPVAAVAHGAQPVHGPAGRPNRHVVRAQRQLHNAPPRGHTVLPARHRGHRSPARGPADRRDRRQVRFRGDRRRFRGFRHGQSPVRERQLDGNEKKYSLNHSTPSSLSR